MNYQRRAATSEQRIRIVAEIYFHISHRRNRSPVLIDDEIIHVTGMRTFRILEPMFFRIRIEMRSGSFESRTFTLGKLMEVDCMRARRKILQVKLYPDAFAGSR